MDTEANWGTAGHSYGQQHSHVRWMLGSASGYLCAHCDGTAAHWAWIHGEDRSSIWSYMPLCVRCHTNYDRGLDVRPGGEVAQPRRGLDQPGQSQTNSRSTTIS